MLLLSYNLVNNNEYFKSEHCYRVSEVLFAYSRDISIFKLRIKPHAYWGWWQNSRWVQNCDLPTKKGNCFRFNSGLANLVLRVLIKVTGDLRILTIVQHVDHNLFSEYQYAIHSVTVKQYSKGVPQRWSPSPLCHIMDLRFLALQNSTLKTFTVLVGFSWLVMAESFWIR